ncbi:digalactosyldiacylglycerol synthase 1, chloroplastic-like isoform X2 [Coffea arabica]|uniref:Digalactosyldiacylglycerol synthase 1, chloroplastic n=1 Tax=Coffea arabica TaxID=13443 RepID=A0A6P6T2C4_COFAR|nr:digalactosyldiacylglycerol synthase 1, chloroplastic-like isoform X2 [Coffea arabica]
MMLNMKTSPEARTTSSSSSSPSRSIVTAEKAFSFISKGWSEVRSSAGADLQLIKNRANSFKNRADRELENFLNSASRSPFAVPTITASATTTPAEIDFVKKLRPKLTEIRRAYSSPDFKWSQWSPKPKIRIDLSAIKNAIVSEVEDEEEDERQRFRRWRTVRFKETAARDEWQFGELWEPIRALKARLREFEHKSSSSSSLPSDIFEGIKNSEFVEKLKSSLRSIGKESNGAKMQEVPPFDVPELLAYLVRQSSPFLDQLGIKRDISDKIVENLCSKRKNQLLLRSLPAGESSIIEADNVTDELGIRIASVLQSTGHCYEGGFWSDSTKQEFADGKRHVAIVTTASLPWMTGTAVNPLFRAAYLAKSAKQNVTLLVPWLCRSDQELVYPNSLTFNSPEEQELYMRNWLEERVGFKADFNISFYPGKFSKARRSIIPAGDTSQFISSKEADIAILEEPEHLNWYHHGKRWTDKFNHVVGIVHTNYLEYIKREKNGALQAFLVKHINNWVTRAYCHKVLRLSAATQDLPKSVICNVHGVNPKFLRIGEKVAEERERGQQAFSKGAYFLGKMVWAKGYKELIDLLAKYKNDLDGFKLDVFGNGEDAYEVKSMAQRLNLNVSFMKGRDHADDSLHGYKVFINPSISDVLCTATAEALAMGKFVICADHPSNEFFSAFPNCLTYKTPEDFVAKVKEAMANEPQPLTPEQMYRLSWEAATQRFMEYSDLDKVLTSNAHSGRIDGKALKKSISLPNLMDMVDGGLAFGHYCLTGNEFLRLCSGAIPGTRDYDKEHCRDLHLLPPQVENPIYGW